MYYLHKQIISKKFLIKPKYVSYWPKYTKQVFNLITFFLTLLLLSNKYYFFFYKHINTIITITFIVYILINLWFYFQNIYKFSTYTTSIQRFWKRTFMLFWLIEGFLFSIFIYLYFISPEETQFFNDHNKQHPFLFKNSYRCLANVFILSVTSIMTYITLLNKKNYNYFKINIILIITTIMLLNILYLEFVKFFNTLSYFTLINDYYTTRTFIIEQPSLISISDSLSNNNSLVNYSFERYKKPIHYYRTIFCYTLLINILKFWHIVFIVILYILTIHKSIYNKLSFDILSVNHQNTIYLLYLYLTVYIFLVKDYIYISLKWVYFWFFVNNNYYNTALYLILETRLIFLLPICANHCN